MAGVLLAASLPAGCSAGSSRNDSEEYYEAILLSGAKVGWSHTVRKTVEEEGRPLVRTRNTSELTLTRDGQPVTQQMVLTSWETPDGKLVRFETEQDGGAMSASGEVKDGQLTVRRTTLGKIETETGTWKNWGGFFAPTDSLQRKPMQPGEKRVVRSLAPLLNVAANTKLEALAKELVEFPQGERELLKIRGTLLLPGSELEMLFWVDDQGNVLRTRVPAIDQEAVRVPKGEALRRGKTQDFDLLRDTVVKLPQPPPDFREVQRVVYRATLKTGQIAGVFSQGLSQRVKLLDDQAAELTVLAVRPDWPEEDDLEDPSSGDFLAPTTFLQSDDQEVKKIAESVAADETDSWEIARAMERHIQEVIRQKDYATAFASAAEVARSLEGDCTEHAVLLAACLRARRIPSHVAFGLVYVPSLQGFAYHMWTESEIKGRWVPLDATQGRGGIGCDHLKLGESSLQGSQAYVDILRVVSVFRQLELSVVSAE
jgi:hypothetical protein